MGFFKFLDQFPWIISSIAIASSFVIFAILGIFLVRKFIKAGTLKAHHDVAGFVFTNLGVLYSVMLGFTVISVQARFDKVKEHAQIEASYVSQLYRDAEVFSESDKNAIQKAVKAYAESVIHEEWAHMKDAVPNPSTIAALKSIGVAVFAVKLEDKKQEIWYGELINKLNNLMNARLSRLLGGQESLGTEMWTLLILGAFVIVTFIWFFNVENIASHILMASLLAISTSFLLFLVYSLDTSFTGQVRVEPEALERILHSFQ